MVRLHRLPDLGQDLLDQEAGVAVAQRVVLEAAVEARQRAVGRGRHHARVDEDADRDRHLALVDEVVEDHRHAPVAVFLDVAAPSWKTMTAAGFAAVVLLGT